MSQFFPLHGQSIGASASVLPVTIQDWFPLGLTGLISLQSKGLSSLLQHHSSNHQFFGTQLSLRSLCWGRGGDFQELGHCPLFGLYLGTVMVPLGVSFSLLIENQGLVEVDLSAILGPFDSNGFMLCPWVMSFFLKLCPAPLPSCFITTRSTQGPRTLPQGWGLMVACDSHVHATAGFLFKVLLWQHGESFSPDKCLVGGIPATPLPWFTEPRFGPPARKVLHIGDM